jgi:hypothetical protein
MYIGECGEVAGILIGRKTWSTREKTCPFASFWITDDIRPIWDRTQAVAVAWAPTSQCYHAANFNPQRSVVLLWEGLRCYLNKATGHSSTSMRFCSPQSRVWHALSDTSCPQLLRTRFWTEASVGRGSVQYGKFQKELTMVFQILLCGEWDENIST